MFLLRGSLYIFQSSFTPFIFLLHHLPQPGTLYQGARLICLSKRVLPLHPTPPSLPCLPFIPPSPAAGHHRSSSSTASQPREIEMLRAGTTAPLIKFPRLIPADPLIALSHQALQGDGGRDRENNKQTIIQH